MKGLNIKRIAALGLGAALVGSALAPAVMAGVFSNVDTLQKTNVIDSTGTPVVDIVVGSMGHASDVVWAGNIAAKVAQLATVDAAAAAPTVDITVGGTATTAGAGDTIEAAVDFDLAENDFANIQVTDSKMPSLVNETSAELTWAGTDITTTIKEVLKGTMNVDFQGDTSSSKYATGELFGSVEAGDLNYAVELGTVLDMTKDLANLDGNSDYDVKLPWLGKTYILDEVKKSGSLVMYADTTPTDLEVGAKLTVTPASGYAGKTMEIQLIDLIQVGSGNQTYEPKWALVIDGATVKYVQKKADVSYDLKDEFGKSYFTNNIYVTAAGLNLAANKYTATVRTGSERLELKNGKGYPFTDDSTVDDKAQWKVVFDTNGTAGFVNKILLVNQWAYKKTSGSETDTSKYVLKVGEAITLPNDFATFKFAGLQNKPSVDVLIGEVDDIEGGGIQYVDLRGNTIKVPFYKQFDIDHNDPTELTIAGKDYTFFYEDINADALYANVFYTEGKHSDADYATAKSWTKIAQVPYNAVVDNNINYIVQLDLGAETKTGSGVDTNYKILIDKDNMAGLALAAQTFNVQNKTNATNKAYVTFNGVDGNLFYMANTEDFLETLLNSTEGAYNADHYLVADATYVDNNTYQVLLNVRTGDTASVLGYKSLNSTDNTLIGNNATADAIAANWSIGADVDEPLLAALTQDGSLVESDGSVFTITVPEEARNAEVYLGSTEMTPGNTGGTKYTGVAVKDIKGNVTIDAINGTAGKTVVSVGEIVRLDTASGMGKSIIVGGQLVNNMAKNLQVSGQTLEERLINNGDYVAAVLDNGSVVVAGWTAEDTAVAAKALIAQLESFM